MVHIFKINNIQGTDHKYYVNINSMFLLKLLGEAVNREGIIDTPKRVEKAWREMTINTNRDFNISMNDFELLSTSCKKIKMENIKFASQCEHHLLPFTGEVSIEYIPKSRIIGLSKFIRIVQFYSKKLQLQEQLGHQIGDCLFSHLDCESIKVVVKSNHNCIICRGVMDYNHQTITENIFN